jgi:hypothetical protein
MAMQQLQGSAREELAGLIVKNIELQERIEALERALREIAEWDDNGDQIAGDIARAALAPEQDK